MLTISLQIPITGMQSAFDWQFILSGVVTSAVHTPESKNSKGKKTLIHSPGYITSSTAGFLLITSTLSAARYLSNESTSEYFAKS